MQKKLTQRSLWGVSLLLGSVVSGSLAYAATETDNLSVTATVTNECSLTIDRSGLAFGTIDVDTVDGNSIQDDAEVGLLLACTTAGASSATLTVGGGLNADSSVRRMSSGGKDYLTYHLYRDQERTDEIRINGEINPDVKKTGPSEGGEKLTIYGRVPPQSDLAEGSYSDTVLITTTYEPGS
jgi:spore coat protein U-like protein